MIQKSTGNLAMVLCMTQGDFCDVISSEDINNVDAMMVELFSLLGNIWQ